MAYSLQQQLEQDLLVTTSSTIFHHSRVTNRVLFECENADSIANCAASRDNSSLPSVQAYSIPTAELLPSQQPHPSPPSVIAISDDGSVLISASPAPPTVHIQDRRRRGSAPVNFQPTDALTSVTCAAFQVSSLEQQSLYTKFLLGFQDGKMVLYRLFLPAPASHNEPSSSNRMQSFQLQPVRVGAINKLHKATMGGITAAEFVPGYRSRIISIGHDGRCRLHVSGPATCLTVLAESPDFSRGRKDKTVLLCGDATEEEERVFEGSKTLIAIGTQAGKVMVFNVLGLLIHEIGMDAPIIHIEWIGDMSAPSMLPNRVSTMSPEPHSLQETLVEDIEASLSDAESTGTVRRTISPLKSAANKHGISIGLDLFSGDKDERTSLLPSRRPSDVSNGSPLQVKRTREHPRRKSSIRPRIVTETFRAPESPRTHSSQIGAAAPPTEVKTTDPSSELAQSSPIPPTSHFPGIELLLSNASQYSLNSNDEFFTPPSTRREIGKVPARNTSQTPPNTAPQNSSAPTAPIVDTSPSSLGSSSSLVRAISQAPQRQVTIEAPDTPSSLDSSNILDSRPTSRVFRQSFTRFRKEASSPPRTRTPPRQMARVDAETFPDLDSPSSLYSRPTSRMFRHHAGDIDGEMSARVYGRHGRDRSLTEETHAPDEPQERDFKVARRKRSATIGVGEEVRKLRDDNDVLRQEMEALRVEFRALKDVLLASNRR
ncbi:hypothetical protein FB567DRAFT_454152 [Paraphoma chrysanthemicola]|uniref:WD40 repeat-like protein n=1 Tax=Paraphoma chrysanthemicola TaxID=798071 RepID=A0A8K0VTA0_9PLEO|nr:hypothetical protein FB567DRAFT_454152 [Paraphoma chrysanthemicola]